MPDTPDIVLCSKLFQYNPTDPTKFSKNFSEYLSHNFLDITESKDVELIEPMVNT